jgi:hypothetical protein
MTLPRLLLTIALYGLAYLIHQWGERHYPE